MSNTNKHYIEEIRYRTIAFFSNVILDLFSFTYFLIYILPIIIVFLTFGLGSYLPLNKLRGDFFFLFQ